MSFLPLTLLDLANQLFAATGQKEKKGKRPGAAGECWITQLSDWCANTRRWFDSQPRYLLLTVPLWGIQFTTTATCTTSHFLMTLSSLRVIIRGGQISRSILWEMELMRKLMWKLMLWRPNAYETSTNKLGCRRLGMGKVASSWISFEWVVWLLTEGLWWNFTSSHWKAAS